MVLHVHIHVTQSNNLLAQVAVGRPSAIGKFMCCESRQDDLWRRVEGIALLRYFQVTEAAENQLRRADSCSMSREIWY
jgi:hypothetical protein